MGDGTYFHSGSLAIRAGGRGGANITYKILFNDAVAMTGGQPVDGSSPSRRSCTQVASEGAKRVVVVTDDTETYRGVRLPGRRAGASPARSRCGAARAARDRGRHGPGLRPDLRGREAPPAQARQLPPIRPSACSSTQRSAKAAATAACSRTASRSRRSRPSSAASAQIDQSSCNKDYSCVEGFCPSFVTVLGGELRKSSSALSPAPDLHALPEPAAARASARRRAIRHAGRRRRRHGRDHRRRAARHGRAPGGQGRQRARLDRRWRRRAARS